MRHVLVLCLAALGCASHPSKPVSASEPRVSAVAHATARSEQPRVVEVPRTEVGPSPDPDVSAIQELEKALRLYEQFIERAGTDERYAEAVQRSQMRIADIRDTLMFLYEGVASRTPK